MCVCASDERRWRHVLPPCTVDLLELTITLTVPVLKEAPVTDSVLGKRPESVAAVANGHGESPTWDVNLAVPDNSDLAIRTRAQSAKRDELAAANPPKGVYLECSDGGTVDCTSKENQPFFSPPTKKLIKIDGEVAEALETAPRGTKVQFPGVSEYYNFLSGGSSPSSRAPMRADRTTNLDTITRPYERQLIAKLASTRGQITHGEMMRDALDVCGGDRTLAILTMHNFTKGMAGIERRQIKPDEIAPEMRDAYQQSTIDSIFNRIEGMTDDPSERYNKEGAIYHYYGAMFASAEAGPVGSLGVLAYNNLSLRPFGYGGESDRIKEAASKLGAQYWFALTPAEYPLPDLSF